VHRKGFPERSDVGSEEFKNIGVSPNCPTGKMKDLPALALGVEKMHVVQDSQHETHEPERQRRPRKRFAVLKQSALTLVMQAMQAMS
jgi:hypothetical protein